MEVHEDGYKNLIEKDGSYGASDVLFDGEKWLCTVHRVCCGVICGGFLIVGVV